MRTNMGKLCGLFLIAPLFLSTGLSQANSEVLQRPQYKTIQVEKGLTIDSDTIETKLTRLSFDSRPAGETHFSASISSLSIDADPDSGLRAPDIGEGEQVDYLHSQLGLRMPVHNTIHAEIGLGYQTYATDGDAVSWKAALDGYFFNSLYARLSAEKSLYAVSPLAISRDVLHTVNGVELSWAPTDKLDIGVLASRSEFSDNNKRLYFSIHPKWVINSTENRKYSLGLRYIDFSFDEDLSNGYYDPQQARKYMLTAKATLQNADSGPWNFVAAIGQRMDDRIDTYDEALEFHASRVFKLHPDFDLELRAVALREGAGQFEAYWWYDLVVLWTARF